MTKRTPSMNNTHNAHKKTIYYNEIKHATRLHCYNERSNAENNFK